MYSWHRRNLSHQQDEAPPHKTHFVNNYSGNLFYDQWSANNHLWSPLHQTYQYLISMCEKLWRIILKYIIFEQSHKNLIGSGQVIKEHIALFYFFISTDLERFCLKTGPQLQQNLAVHNSVETWLSGQNYWLIENQE